MGTFVSSIESFAPFISKYPAWVKIYFIVLLFMIVSFIAILIFSHPNEAEARKNTASVSSAILNQVNDAYEYFLGFPPRATLETEGSKKLLALKNVSWPSNMEGVLYQSFNDFRQRCCIVYDDLMHDEVTTDSKVELKAHYKILMSKLNA